ncbi:MAG TPA: metal-dependent phosphohydrolase [Anaerolineae bacterium]|nr:metal-dependent phosphohydrolase [Anaerolineae bacterium]
MLNLQEIVITTFVDELKRAYQQTYNLIQPQYGNIIAWSGQLALENIANSDALYHNVEHTIMVTLVGQAILRGKHICEGGVSPEDWLHFILGLLHHDIGYVRGICKVDRGNVLATGLGDDTVTLDWGTTDASLTPYHVDRSKLFVRERFGSALLANIDVDRILDYIEMTRFPMPDESLLSRKADEYARLARAADFIGQLGDPGYLRKMPTLFYELEEAGVNANIGYQNPVDMREKYAHFYANVVLPHIQDALRYLRVTQDGKQWIANLHAHVFSREHDRMLRDATHDGR